MERFTAKFVCQTLSLALFLLGVVFAEQLAERGAPLSPEFFLWLDPAAGAATVLAGRALYAGFGFCLVVLIGTLLLGRFFCGYLCPLGALIDSLERPGRSLRRQLRPALNLHTARRVKYGLLGLLLGAALTGVSLVHLATPLPLLERAAAAFSLGGESLLAALQGVLSPLLTRLGLSSLAFAEVRVVTPSGWGWSLALLFLALGGTFLAPRFWCRVLCPSGALLALLGGRPLLRRQVAKGCTRCGRCARSCPMGAIPGGDPLRTDHGECIACQRCARVCPENVVLFPVQDFGQKRSGGLPASGSRRALLGIAGSGLGLGLAVGAAGAAGAVGLSRKVDAVDLLPPRPPKPGRELGPTDRAAGPGPWACVRPPGALPETEFLARCLRCAKCVQACPSRTLQPAWEPVPPHAEGEMPPAWAGSWLAGVLAPRLTPSLGPCEPNCTRCGEVCPTGALAPLGRAAKLAAKVGTAVVLRKRCIAWAEDKACLVCDEVCPFNAIELRRVPGVAVGVPYVYPERCLGCGFCEHHCPARPKDAAGAQIQRTDWRAVVVRAQGAVRLPAGGDHLAVAEERGLSIQLDGGHGGDTAYGQGTAPYDGLDAFGAQSEEALPPGFSRSGEGAGDGLPPGFSEGEGEGEGEGAEGLPPGFTEP